MPREQADILHSIENILRSCEHADEEFAKYLNDVGVERIEDWRSEVHSLLQRTNEHYRRQMLSKLRASAAVIRAADSESPLSNLISIAVAQERTLRSRLIQVNVLFEDCRNALPPPVQDELRGQVSVVADSVELIGMRVRSARGEYLSIRPAIAAVLSEVVFDTLTMPLKSPLPSRSQKRPLYRVAEKVRALHAILKRVFKETQRMHQVVAGVETPNLPEMVIEEVRQLSHRVERARWRQNDLLLELEEWFIVAETTPSLLPLAGHEVSTDDVLLAVEKYERLRKDLTALHESSVSVEQHLDSIRATLNDLPALRV